jgi:hypothetical protein
MAIPASRGAGPEQSGRRLVLRMDGVGVEQLVLFNSPLGRDVSVEQSVVG